MLFILEWIVITILVFTVVVLVHELGHFLAARMFGVKVYEFWIGIPPKLFAFYTDKYGTEYTINALPLGGFVRMLGETEKTDDETEGNLSKKPLWQKLVVILAGVFMNFLLAVVAFSVLFTVGVTPIGVNTKFPTNLHSHILPTVDDSIADGFLHTDGVALYPLKNSIAQQAGIGSGDILLSVNGQKIITPQQVLSTISTSQSTLSLQVLRNKTTLTLAVTPKNGKIGAYIAPSNPVLNTRFVYKYPPIQAVQMGFYETYAEGKLTIDFLGLTVKNIVSPKQASDRTEAVNSLSGPIGAGQIFVGIAQAHAGFAVIVCIAMLISINLGVFNLLPIPALDWWRAVFMIIRAVLSRFSASQKIAQWENAIHIATFAILICLSLFVAYHDVIRIVTQ